MRLTPLTGPHRASIIKLLRPLSGLLIVIQLMMYWDAFYYFILIIGFSIKNHEAVARIDVISMDASIPAKKGKLASFATTCWIG